MYSNRTNCPISSAYMHYVSFYSLLCILLVPTISTELLYELQYTYCHECYPLDMEAAKQSVFYRK